MAKYVRAIMLPNLSTLMAALMVRAVPYEDGFNIQANSGKSIGFIEITTEDEALRAEHFMRTAMILNEIINDPKHAVQPDWSYLKQVQVAAPAETAVMPSRTMKKVDAGGETKTV